MPKYAAVVAAVALSLIECTLITPVDRSTYSLRSVMISGALLQLYSTGTAAAA